jgi:hypothetical protein
LRRRAEDEDEALAEKSFFPSSGTLGTGVAYGAGGPGATSICKVYKRESSFPSSAIQLKLGEMRSLIPKGICFMYIHVYIYQGVWVLFKLTGLGRRLMGKSVQNGAVEQNL